jgi:type VI secretion system protein ImpM
VSRRLDGEFVAAWDAWLQKVIGESREALGSTWLESFLSAPVWRFALPAGMFSGAAWIGVLLPSVDRVGRYFPLTIAAPVYEASIDVPATLAKALPWIDSIEARALEALVPELDLDRFDQRLAEHPLPQDVAVAAAPDDDTVPLGPPRDTFQVWPDSVLKEGALARTASCAIWMTNGGESFARCLAVCSALISGGRFCALLDGRWSEHGWSIAEGTKRDAPAAPVALSTTAGVDFVHGQGNSGEALAPLTASPPSSENATHMSTGLESKSP